MYVGKLLSSILNLGLFISITGFGVSIGSFVSFSAYLIGNSGGNVTGCCRAGDPVCEGARRSGDCACCPDRGAGAAGGTGDRAGGGASGTGGRGGDSVCEGARVNGNPDGGRAGAVGDPVPEAARDNGCGIGACCCGEGVDPCLLNERLSIDAVELLGLTVGDPGRDGGGDCDRALGRPLDDVLLNLFLYSSILKSFTKSSLLYIYSNGGGVIVPPPKFIVDFQSLIKSVFPLDVL